MKTYNVLLLYLVVFIFLAPHAAHSQQAEQPIYADGDWWKVKIEREYIGEGSPQGSCNELYPEYMVKFESGKPAVYGPNGKIDCYQIAEQLLSLVPEGAQQQYRYLKFPLAVGTSWTEQLPRTIPRRGTTKTVWDNIEYKVLAAEKVQTPKGEFDALKIEMTGRGNSVRIYHYAPKAKAVVQFELTTNRIKHKMVLVDLQVGQ